VAFYTRRLPHWQPRHAEFFVTWRLHGSLPRRRYFLPPSVAAGKAFVAFDRQLDAAASGPLWMKDPQVAECVSQILLSGGREWQLYQLRAWVVMANHVHVLMQPRVPLWKVLMNVKSASARAANAVLGRKGKHFWQDESYDRWVTNDAERSRIIRYIEHNPVSAGLVATPEEWAWSSAAGQRMAPPHQEPGTAHPKV
jgi:putative transposase